MPRTATIYHPPPQQTFICPLEDCHKTCRSAAGRIRHIRAKHSGYDRPASPHSATMNEDLLSSTASALASPGTDIYRLDDIGNIDAGDEEICDLHHSPGVGPCENNDPTPTASIEYHPLLSGKHSTMYKGIFTIILCREDMRCRGKFS